MADYTKLGSIGYDVRFDVADLKAGIREANASLAGLRIHAQSQLEGVERQAKESGGRISSTLKGMFSVAGGLALAAGASGFFGALTESVVGFNASLETSKVALASSYQGMARQRGIVLDYGNALQLAGERIGQIQKYAAATPFEFPDLVEANRLLNTFGVTAPKYLSIIGDAAAGIGGTAEQLKQVAFWFGRLNQDASKGEAIQNLTQLGVLSQKDLKLQGIKFDLSGAVNKDDVDKVAAAAAKVFEEKFAGAADKIGQTFSGKLSTLKDNVTQALAQAGSPIFEKVLKPGLDALNSFMSSPAFSEGVGKVADFVARTVGDAVKMIGGLAQALQNSGVLQAAGQVAEGIGSIIGALIEFVTTNQAILDFAGNALTVFSNSLKAAADLLRGDFASAGAVAHDTLAKLGGTEFADQIERGFDRVKQASGSAADFLNNEVWPRFMDGAAKAGSFFEAWGDSIGRGWNVATNTISLGIANVADMVNGNATGTYGVLNNISNNALETARRTVAAVAAMSQAVTGMLLGSKAAYSAFSFGASSLGPTGNLSSAEAKTAAAPRTPGGIFDAARLVADTVASVKSAVSKIPPLAAPHFNTLGSFLGAMGQNAGASIGSGIGKGAKQSISHAKAQIEVSLGDLSAELRSNADKLSGSFAAWSNPANFTAFDAASKIVEAKLKDLKARGEVTAINVTPLLFSYQTALAAAIGAIEKEGAISETTIAKVKAALAGLGPAAQAAVVVQLRLLANMQAQESLQNQIGKIEVDRGLALSSLNQNLEDANATLAAQKLLVEGTSKTIANLADDYSRANQVVAEAKGEIDKATQALQEQQRAQALVVDGVNAEYDARRKGVDETLARASKPLKDFGVEQDRKAAEFANRKLAAEQGGRGPDAIKAIEEEQKKYEDSQRIRGEALRANAQVAADDHDAEMARIDAEQATKIANLKAEQAATNAVSQQHISDLTAVQAHEQEAADRAKANLDAINLKQLAQTAAVADTTIEVEGLNDKIKAVNVSYDSLEKPLKNQLIQLREAQPLLQTTIDKANTRAQAEQGVNDKLDTQIGLIKQMINATPDPKATYARWHSLGEQAGQGYLDGIKSKQQDIAAAAGGNTNAGINATKQAQKSNSPSLVYFGLGDDAMAGYRNAIINARAGIVQAVGETTLAGAAAASKADFGNLPRANLQGYVDRVAANVATGSLSGSQPPPVRIEVGVVFSGQIDGVTDAGLARIADGVTPHVGAAVMQTVGRILGR